MLKTHEVRLEESDDMKGEERVKRRTEERDVKR